MTVKKSSNEMQHLSKVLKVVFVLLVKEKEDSLFCKMKKNEIIKFAKRLDLDYIKKPEYCRVISFGKEHTEVCCFCGEYENIVFQEGDGKQIHSLCEECYKKFKHFCKGEKVWMPICKECADLTREVNK